MKKSTLALSFAVVIVIAVLFLPRALKHRKVEEYHVKTEHHAVRETTGVRADSLFPVELAKNRSERRIVVIGLDGASWNIINPMIKRGQLPTFKKLLTESAYGTLRSLILQVSPPAWTAMFSGCKPWKTGIYGFGELDTLTREIVSVDSRDIRVPRVWDMAGLAGLRTAVINVPLTYPPTKLNGIMVSGMLTPQQVVIKKVTVIRGALKHASMEELKAYGEKSYAEPKKTQVTIYDSRVTAYLIDGKDDGKAEYTGVLLAMPGERVKTHASLREQKDGEIIVPRQVVSCSFEEYTPWLKILVNRQDNPELAWVRLSPELAGRNLVKLICTPAYRNLCDAEVRFCYPESLRTAISERFDRFIPLSRYVVPTLPDQVDDQAEHLDFFYDYDDWDLFIYQFQITDVVEHLDGEGKYTQAVYMRLDNLLRNLIDRLPENTTLLIVSDHGSSGYSSIINLNAALKEMNVIATTRSGEIDYKNSIAFHMNWGIFVNKDELARRWKIIPGFHPSEGKSLYDAFLDFLIEKARGLTYPRSGKPLPVTLIRPPKIRAHPSPDLIVQPQYRDYYIHHEDIFRVGEPFILSPKEEGRKYHHRRAGMFLVRGNGIRKGYEGKPAQIYDIAPTILYLLGLPVADQFDGSIMKDIFEEDYLTSHPPTRIHSYGLASAEAIETDVQRERLEEKLRAIGYIK